MSNTLHYDVKMIMTSVGGKNFLNFLFIDEREREGNINLLFHLLMDSLVASCI